MNLSWLPNAICIGRLLLVAPLVALLLREHYAAALALILVAGASDVLDGFLAKTFNWRSRLGSLLDPAADKVLVVSTFLTLTFLGLVPLALTAVVVLRDVVIVLGALVYQVLVAPIHGEPTVISKLNTMCQLSFVLLVLTHAAFGWPAPLVLTLLGAAVFFTSVISGTHYVHSWSRRLRQPRQATA